jgi:hypothetical protein
MPSKSCKNPPYDMGSNFLVVLGVTPSHLINILSAEFVFLRVPAPCAWPTALLFSTGQTKSIPLFTSSAFFQFAKTWWSVACTNKPLSLSLCLSLKFSHYLCLASSVNIFGNLRVCCGQKINVAFCRRPIYENKFQVNSHHGACVVSNSMYVV